ncbi:MAG: DUF6526 family protein [Gemmatimonadetes bacterium]|nr:DUF6526 family protein [Gemmatimonadota bacterium]
MATVPPQDIKSHRRWVPAIHFVALPILFGNVIFASWQAVRIPTLLNSWSVLVAVALAIVALMARVMVNTVQDRVIRLEMGGRLGQVLTGASAGRINELTRKQFVGLRFAGDAELPGLVERCLSGELATDEQIKRQIKNWQPDWLRA